MLYAGADVVFSPRAYPAWSGNYKGRTIFHGLNNFAVWAPLLSPNYKGKFNKTEFSDQEEWSRKRIARFGFVPDPDYPTYPFHPESVHTAAAKCIVRDGKIAETRLIPLLVGKDGVTRVLHRDELGQKTFDYIVRITDSQNLNVRYEWKGDEMVIIER
jgi:poly-gamma-glutamate synthesis protein (capsule biosynthesis protein)